MRRHALAGVGALAGAALGFALHHQGAALPAALGLAFAAAVAGGLTARYYEYLPDEDAWPVARWSGAFIAVTMAGTFLALSHGGPLDPETTFALQLFVLATAWNAFVIGVVAAEERHRHVERSAESDAELSGM